MKKVLTQLLLTRLKTDHPDKNFVFTKEDDEYIPFSFSNLTHHIVSLTDYFVKLGLSRGDKVAIISENRTEWVSTDFAAMFSGLITVPVYTSLSPSQIKYILHNSESKVCFVSGSSLLRKVYDLKSELPSLEKIVVFNDTNLLEYNSGFVENFSSIVESVVKKDQSEVLQLLERLSQEISEDDLLTIIYTSGTTGIPKGVKLSHLNLYSNIIACQMVLTINEHDTFLSYLPYSHAYERTTGYYLALFSGAKIYYAQSIETIAKQLTEVKPTIVITVPRLLDKIYNKLLKSGDNMEDGLKKNIFRWAVGHAKGSNVSKGSLKWKIADKLVYKKIRDKTGSKVRFFVSGGGALNKSVGEFFDNIGITILEGYGMTETSPVISVNPPSKNKYGTVGKPLSGVSVKLSGDNEILVSGELVMEGYYKEDNLIHEIIEDGWLKTGDIGEIDHEGYLKITDRKKSLIKTSGGKYVSPTQIEDMISSLNYVETCVVVGNERMYITALIVPEKNDLINFAKKNNIEAGSYSELIKTPSLIKLIQKDIDRLQTELANYERVRKFILIEKSFSIESGELTPTMKVKRKFVEGKFSNEIENMYLKI